MPFSSFFTTRSEKGHKRRSCEEINHHFFTAPLLISCYLTLFTFMRRSSTRRHMETKKVMMK